MKAPAQAQLQLLALQACDIRLSQLDHRERTLPQHAALTEVTDRIAELQTDVITAQAELSDLARAVQRAEDEVERVRNRAKKDQQLLDSGSINAKQMQDLQHEIESLGRRQSELEDAELEVMELAEEAQGKVSLLTAALEEAKARQSELSAELQAAVAEIAGEKDACAKERPPLAAAIPDDLLALYEKLRADLGGVGAAALKAGRCEGCHMQIPPTDLKHLADAPEDEVQRCEECRRILVRT